MSDHVIRKRGLRWEHDEKNIQIVPQTPGFYRLFHGDKVIIHGVTSNLRKRLLEHSHNPNQRFGTFTWFQTKSMNDAGLVEENLREYEKATYTLLEIPIETFISWNKRKQLQLSPKFQRRGVWKPVAKSYFLDTIIRGLPSPPVYIREVILSDGITQHQVVDGQQRLRSIIEFATNKITLMRKHNSELGNRIFSNLTSEIQNKFLNYKLPVQLLQNATDLEVLDIFARLNTYNVRLNAQELRNAKYDGEFKSCVYYLANTNRKFFIENKILYPHQIVRMIDAELVSELVITMMDGLQNSKKSIESFYREYDPEFNEADNYINKFNNIIMEIERVFNIVIRKTKFKRKSLFYTLFGVMYHIMYGLPKEGDSIGRISSEHYQEARDVLTYISQQLQETVPDVKFAKFVQNSQRRTDDLVPRQIRHRDLLNEITPYVV
ncbi:hypothetical protein ES707_17158 [subsurface metagenome]